MVLSYEGTFKTLDRGLIEVVGPLGSVRLLSIVSFLISRLNSGLVFINIFYMVVGLCFILVFVLIFDNYSI